MQTKEFSTTEHSESGSWHPQSWAMGLWIGAFGNSVQAVAGAKDYPKVPPGIPLLFVVVLLVYLTSRSVWPYCSARNRHIPVSGFQRRFADAII
jgi:hypothetical protein